MKKIIFSAFLLLSFNFAYADLPAGMTTCPGFSFDSISVHLHFNDMQKAAEYNWSWTASNDASIVQDANMQGILFMVRSQRTPTTQGRNLACFYKLYAPSVNRVVSGVIEVFLPKPLNIPMDIKLGGWEPDSYAHFQTETGQVIYDMSCMSSSDGQCPIGLPPTH